MTIKFKCACGRELDVPEETAGREAFCPGCRKSVPVPEKPELNAASAGDEREASEFKPGALASLLGGEAPAGESKKPKSEAPAEPEPAPGKSKEERAQEAQAVGDSIPAPDPKKEEGAAIAQEKPKADPQKEPAKESRPEEVPESEVKAEEANETQDVPPPGVEVLPDRIKFHCMCGQKVAVRVPAPQSAGKCPRCKRTLTVPSVPGVTDKQPGTAKKKRTKTSAKELRHCSKCGRRIEDPNAAFCPRCGSPLEARPAPRGGRRETAKLPAGDMDTPASAPAAVSAAASPPSSDQVRQRSAREAADRAAKLLRPPSRMEVPNVGEVPSRNVLGQPAGVLRRLGSFLLDAMAASGVAVVAHYLASRAGLDAALLPSALAALAAFAVINEVVFAALSGGRSLGMLVTGVGVRNHEGQPAGLLLLLVRLLASLVLFIGAPLVVIDSQRRTLHDIVCGTTVRRLSGA